VESYKIAIGRRKTNGNVISDHSNSH